MTAEKGTCMDVNFSSIVMVCSAGGLWLISFRIVHKIGGTIHQEQANPE